MHIPVITTALLLAVLSASCGSTAATSETDVARVPSATSEPTILFQRSDTRRTHVALVGIDGSGKSAPLAAFGTGDQTNPDWSPDGRQFVFVMTDGTTDDLYVAD